MIKLDIQLFGGRGQKNKINLSGVPKNKRKAFESNLKQIEIHKNKIEEAKSTGKNTIYINHWEKEIRTLEKNNEKILDRRDRKRK